MDSTDTQNVELPAGARSLHELVSPVGRRGKYKTYFAKVGTMSGTLVVIKRARRFYVGQRVEYAREDNLRGMSVGVTPPWQRGTIWKIEYDRLFINRG